jgi:DNA (cytosine-5)-methyltransferase 1
MAKRQRTPLTGSSGSFYEFFAGGGMARAGLGSSWQCLFSNDFDEKKVSAYTSNWGDLEIKAGDVAALTPADLPGRADLVWGSFPCQDLSLAGNGAGLMGTRSGTFWPFWELIRGLGREDRAPSLIVLENVCGALTSHKGQDFYALAEAIAADGYRLGALVIDAVHFLPQSRPRLFIVAVHERVPLPETMTIQEPSPTWSSAALMGAYAPLSRAIKDRWIWWNLPAPSSRVKSLADVIEAEPTGVRWHSKEETARLLEMMSPVNRKKVQDAKRLGRLAVGTIYKRTRPLEDGSRVQRAEVRFDDIAGCLRTPVGGSSRQLLIFVENSTVRTRLLSPREAARLMGLPESYTLPSNYNEAYHLAGDGVAVPVVRHLAEYILEPLLRAYRAQGREAA